MITCITTVCNSVKQPEFVLITELSPKHTVANNSMVQHVYVNLPALY